VFRVPRQWSRIAGTFLALAALVGVVPEAAWAGVLTRDALTKVFPAPYLVKEREQDLPVWPIFKQSGPPNFTTDLVGYVFESADLAPVPGFSGTPINLLVAINANGEFMDVAVLSHHEPVFLGGVGEEPLVRFLTQYKGLGLKQNITVGSSTARTVHLGGTNVYLDGISRATASLRIINQSVLSSALKVARTKLGFSGSRDPDLIAHIRTDLFEPQRWNELWTPGWCGTCRFPTARSSVPSPDRKVQVSIPRCSRSRTPPSATSTRPWSRSRWPGATS
jgi:transcriptional regulator of nitric oxide reductase